MGNAPDFVLFLGRFHPLVVHLPIGFLFFAFVLEVFSRWKKNPALTVAIPLALFLGAISGALACVLGYMLSLSGDYESSALNTHFWLGIATTAIAFMAWLIRIEKVKIVNLDRLRPNISALTLLVVLLSLTGHYGGNLTHGSDFLTKYAPFGKEEMELMSVTNIDDAEVFGHLVAPILQNKCASCHNETKKKGGLSFADSLSIFEGGYHGSALVPGNALSSQMIKRVLLEPQHEDFMPPEGKTPLTDEEVAIITYWIDNAGAGFSNKVAQIETPKTIKDIANAMLGLKSPETIAEGSDAILPTVKTITQDQIRAIEKEGFILRELVFNTGLYEVVLAPNAITEQEKSKVEAKLNVLSPIKDNIIWLTLEDNQIDDESLKQIAKFSNIQKLKLSKNPITDDGILYISNLKSLTSINLFGTAITSKSLKIFSEMKHLKKVYAWQTNIKPEDIETLEASDLPDIILGM